MYGRRYTNTEVDHKWHRQTCIGTFQPQHLLLSSGTSLPKAGGTEMAKDIQCKDRGFTLDELQFTSKLSSNSPAGLREHSFNLKYLKDFQSLSSLSLFELTEISMKNKLISKSHLAQENDLAASCGTSDLKHGSPLSNKSLMPGNTFYKYISNEFDDPCFTPKKEEITFSSTFCKKSNNTNCNKTCSHSSQSSSEVKHGLSYKLEYPWNWKRKPPTAIAEKSKNSFNINTTVGATTKANGYALADFGRGTKPNSEACRIKNLDEITCKIPVTMESCFLQQFEKPCPEINTYLKENLVISPLTSLKAEDTLDYSMDGQNLSICGESVKDGKCIVMKDDFLLQVLLGDTLGFTRCFIFPSDSPLDYLVPLYSMQTNAQCRKQNTSGASHSYGISRDTDNNSHADLYVQGLLPTLNVISNNGNYTSEVKPRQEQICLRALFDVKNSYQHKHSISTNVLTNFRACHVLQRNHLSLPYIDKKTCLFSLSDSYDESFLSTENTSSAQLNYPGQSGKTHFVSDIGFSIFAASLLGTSKNEFSYFERHSLHSGISAMHTFLETVSGSYRYMVTDPRVTLEELEVENSSDTENPVKKMGNAALVELGSLSQRTTTAKPNIHEVPMCQRVASFTEKFEKICLPTIFVKEWNENSQNYLFNENISIDTEHQIKYTNIAQPVNGKATLLKEDHTSPVTHLPCNTLSYETEASILRDPKTLSEMSRSPRPKWVQKNTLIPGSHFHDDILSFDTENESIKVVESNLNEPMDFSVLDVKADSVNAISEVITKNRLCSITSDLRECENTQVPNPSEQLVNGNLELHEISFGSMRSDNPSESISFISDSKGEEDKTCSKHHELTPSTTSKDCTEFEMQSQFSLVLEELKLFHTIGLKTESEIKDGGDLLRSASDELSCDFVDSTAMDVAESKILPKTENRGEIAAPTREKEVSRRYGSACFAMEETHSTLKDGEISKMFLWTPAFSPSYSTLENSMLIEKKERTFSLGIARVTPLKTRTGPLRIGLSKRAKTKQLHPYLR